MDRSSAPLSLVELFLKSQVARCFDVSHSLPTAALASEICMAFFFFFSDGLMHQTLVEVGHVSLFFFFLDTADEGRKSVQTKVKTVGRDDDKMTHMNPPDYAHPMRPPLISGTPELAPESGLHFIGRRCVTVCAQAPAQLHALAALHDKMACHLMRQAN